MPGYDILLNPERKEELENEIGSINRQMEGAFKRMNITDPEVNNLMLGALWFSVYPCREFIVSVQRRQIRIVRGCEKCPPIVKNIPP